MVTGDDYSSDWEKITRDAGGFYDPVTGELDQARFDAARRTALAAFAKRHDVRGAVFPVVVSRDASVVSGVAKWDGAEQLVADSDSKFGAYFTVAAYLTAEFPALSLQLRIVDAGNADALRKLRRHPGAVAIREGTHRGRSGVAPVRQSGARCHRR